MLNTVYMCIILIAMLFGLLDHFLKPSCLSYFWNDCSSFVQIWLRMTGLKSLKGQKGKLFNKPWRLRSSMHCTDSSMFHIPTQRYRISHSRLLVPFKQRELSTECLELCFFYLLFMCCMFVYNYIRKCFMLLCEGMMTIFTCVSSLHWPYWNQM